MPAVAGQRREGRGHGEARDRDPRGRRRRHQHRRHGAARARATPTLGDVRPVDQGQARRATQGRLHAGAALVGSGGSGDGTFTPYWNSTPPLISLATKSLETNADTLQAVGHGHRRDPRRGRLRASCRTRARRSSSRKVFYRSNRGGKDGKPLDFATDLPLWPGSNMVTDRRPRELGGALGQDAVRLPRSAAHRADAVGRRAALA